MHLLRVAVLILFVCQAPERSGEYQQIIRPYQR